MRRWLVLTLGVVMVGAAAWVVRGDVVAEWNAAMLGAIQRETSPPTLASRNLAILHTAVYDAVNAVYGTHTPYLGGFTAAPGTLAEAAAVSAAYQVAMSLYPSQRGAFASLYASSLAQMPNGPGRASGIELGAAVAGAMLSARSGDGSSLNVPYIPSADPGAWRRTAPFYRPPEGVNWPYVTPFTLTSSAQFRPPPPPALDSVRYALDVNEVKVLGARDSAERTAEQTAIAYFWSDFSYTATPPGHWNQMTSFLVEGQGLSLEDEARLFALLNLALADAGIVAWDAKFAFNFWRPATAIQRADEDRNPLTDPDPDWQSLLPAPAFPEYVSGHSTFSGAAGAVLREYFGTDNLHLVAISDTTPGVVRVFDSVQEAVEEVGLSRIYGGIHFASADEQGRLAGDAVGVYVTANYLRPIPEPSMVSLGVMAGVGWLMARGRAGRKPAGRGEGFPTSGTGASHR